MRQGSSIVFNLLALVVVATGFAFLLLANKASAPSAADAPQAPSIVASSSAPVIATTTTSTSATSTAPKGAKASLAPAKQQSKPAPAQSTNSASSASSSADQVARIQNPYSSAPLSSDALNANARAALVNILCLSNGSVAPISGSGVLISPSGVVLTNAHVAQYVLLSENPAVNLSCTVRTGSPAHASFTASVLYIPPIWVNTHAVELNTPDPQGTGEHDYALLLINGAVQGVQMPASFPYLPFDTRNAIGFTGDQALVASYPAEFLGGLEAENALYANSSFTTIGQLLTFGKNSVDVLSLGGIIEAQTGSSGGAVVNPWGYLIGLISTVSTGQTTGERDLRAITLSYINSDMKAQSGTDLSTFLQGNLVADQQNFNQTILPGLMSTYISVLQGQQQ